GGLYNPGITAAAVENGGTATAKVKITFTGTIGEATDKAVAVIYDEASGKALAGEAERQAGEVDVSIAIIDHADLSKLHAYLAFSRPPGHGNRGERPVPPAFRHRQNSRGEARKRKGTKSR
ncbi:MAG: hypothetical protein LBB83_04355, partial [Treponema sp.]|nr:hypothetical protein [Treponema sp.]